MALIEFQRRFAVYKFWRWCAFGEENLKRGRPSKSIELRVGSFKGCRMFFVKFRGRYDLETPPLAGKSHDLCILHLRQHRKVHSCVSVTAWPPVLYKNYTCLLERFGIDTVPMPLSWFLNSKVQALVGCSRKLSASTGHSPAEREALYGGKGQRSQKMHRQSGFVSDFAPP